MSYCLSGPFRMWKPVAQMQNATRLEWDTVHTHAVNDLNGVRILPEMHMLRDATRCYEMLRDATSTKRPRIPGDSGEIQGFPVFPALPLIDLQGSASKIHWHYSTTGTTSWRRIQGKTCNNIRCDSCKSNKASNLKKYDQMMSNIQYT